MRGFKRLEGYNQISTTVGEPPPLCLALDPQEGIREPCRGPIGRLR